MRALSVIIRPGVVSIGPWVRDCSCRLASVMDQELSMYLMYENILCTKDKESSRACVPRGVASFTQIRTCVLQKLVDFLL